jgi:hypothetical protein
MYDENPALQYSANIELFRSQFFSAYKAIVRIHTSLVMSALSFSFVTFPAVAPPLAQFAATLSFAWLISSSIAILTEKVYQPRFLNRKRMNVADFINQSNGPHKSYHIHSEPTYIFRFLAEKEFVSGIISIFFTFLTIPVLLGLSQPLNASEERMTGVFIGQALIVSILYILSTGSIGLARYAAESELKSSGRVTLRSVLRSSVLTIVLLLSFYLAVSAMLARSFF